MPARLVAVVAALVCSLGFGSPSLAQFRPRIVNGLPSADFPTVGALLDSGNFDSASMICSGTLIGCETFLTAGHCVAGDLNPTHYSIYLQHAGLFAVASVSLAPTYSFPVGDVAVLRLATPVTGIVPTPINSVGTPAFGSAGTIAGFGRTGGIDTDYGIKRAGAVTTGTCVPAGVSDATSVCWDFLAPLGPPGTDSSTCNGDSGGPLFVDFGGGDTVAGITSGGENADCLPDDLSFDANVFFYRSFIQSIGGGDLGSPACGSIPQVGGPDTTVLPFAGTLSAGSPEGRHAFTIGAGVNRIRVTMNGLDDGLSDFDLYVKHGSPPTTADYDCRRNGSNQYALCEFVAPAAGTWHVLVSRWVGAGEYQATVTTFGVDCADPPNVGRTCDDGNLCTTGDACQVGGTCAGTAVGNGTPCVDGNSCTGPDACQAGSCTGTPLSDGTPCDDGHICTRGDACQAGACTSEAGPAAGCTRPFLPGKGVLLLKNDLLDATRDRLTWRWAGGGATAKTEFGNPAGATALGLCLYDGPDRILEWTIPPGAPWVETASGFKYTDRAFGVLGLRSISLRSSPTDGRASISIKARGPGMGMVALPLLQSPDVRMQLVGDAGCWEALYSTNLVNQTDQFRAKSD